jgi:UDP-N-acetylglucosamine/UDP-N-acetylgalactosamine diphosphorylase
MPFHRADKKIACVDADGKSVNPEKANGVKFEMFVFDALPFAKNPLVLETAREDDFSPVKNATGVDSAESSRADQVRQFARWLTAAGASVPVDATGVPPFEIEVSPLFGHDFASFSESWSKLNPKPAIEPGLVLG